jgi:hypothetical protein
VPSPFRKVRDPPDGQQELDERSHKHGVGDRAETGPLAEEPREHEDGKTHDDARRPEGENGVAGDSLMEYVPGSESQSRFEDEHDPGRQDEESGHQACQLPCDSSPNLRGRQGRVRMKSQGERPQGEPPGGASRCGVIRHALIFAAVGRTPIVLRGVMLLALAGGARGSGRPTGVGSDVPDQGRLTCSEPRSPSSSF